MSLNTLMAADAKAMMNVNEFAEGIVYQEPGAEDKAILGIVDRSKLDAAELRSKGAPAGGTGYGRLSYQLSIANDAVQGMTSIRTGLDKVQLKKEVDDAGPTTFVVTSILSQDAGAWLLEIMA
jgi:hypothetical protein